VNQDGAVITPFESLISTCVTVTANEQSGLYTTVYGEVVNDASP